MFFFLVCSIYALLTTGVVFSGSVVQVRFGFDLAKMFFLVLQIILGKTSDDYKSKVVD